jgi:transposase
MDRTTVAIDLAKTIFEVAISQQPGHIHQRRRLSRARLGSFLAELPPTTVLLEACGSAHFWARLAQGYGHQVVLLPPHATRPYVLRDKTDRADARALLEAFRNQDIHPIPVKSVDQQALTALHRLRSAWLATRTARLNALRGFLREFGVVIPLGARFVLPQVRQLLAGSDSPLPAALHPTLADTCAEIEELESHTRSLERQLATLAADLPVVARLRSVPGVGLLTATALLAFVGDVHRFRSGRRFANYLGLTPREHSSGSSRHLGSISKRGDPYLRMLLIHGARAVLCHAHRLPRPDRLRAWALQLEQLRGHNKATVALANKLARIVWAVWRSETRFQEEELAA